MSASACSPSRTHYNSTIAVLVHQGGYFAIHGQRVLAPFRQRRDHHSLNQSSHPRLGRCLAVAAMKRLVKVAYHTAIMLGDPRALLDAAGAHGEH